RPRASPWAPRERARPSPSTSPAKGAAPWTASRGRRRVPAVAVKLHRCKNVWVKYGGHPCWRVQKALDQAGVDYVVVRLPWPGPRDAVEHLSGQPKYPVIEFEDGSIYREESKDMVSTIKCGRLMEKRGAAPPAPHAHDHLGHDHDHDHEHEHPGPPA